MSRSAYIERDPEGTGRPSGPFPNTDRILRSRRGAGIRPAGSFGTTSAGRQGAGAPASRKPLDFPAHRRLLPRLLLFVLLVTGPWVCRAGTSVYNVTVQGTDIANNERFVCNLAAGDRVVLDGISGYVCFNTSTDPQCKPCNPGDYIVDPDGLPRAVYDDPMNQATCYDCDDACSDPLPGNGHAGLYLMLNAARTFVGSGGTSFNVTANKALSLGVNDCAGTPNSGSFQVRVTVHRPELSINDVSVKEGNAGTTNAVFTVACSPAPGTGQTVTVNWATADGTATQPGDYTAGSGALSFNAGDGSKTITVAVNGDTVSESNETFRVNLSGATGAAISDSQGTGTITDDDGTPKLYVGGAAVTEGDSGTVNASFTVTLSPTSSSTVTANYATANGTAVSPADFTAASGPLSFTPGQSAKTVTVAVKGDTLDEDNEVFHLDLSNPVNAEIGTGRGSCTVTDNDPLAVIMMGTDLSVTEGPAGATTVASFTVNLLSPSGRTVTAEVYTTDGTALHGYDYTALVQTLTFSPGETSQQVPVNVTGDYKDEYDETFDLNVRNAVNGNIADSMTRCTILDDDGPPTVSIGDATITEGNSGTQDATFVVTLAATSPNTVTVDWATADGTALQPADYTAGSGTLTFTPGQFAQAVKVPVVGDTLDEDDESFKVNLSNPVNAPLGDAQGVCTIIDNDPQTVIMMGADIAVTEGDGAAVNAVFTVNLLAASGKTVSAEVYTTDATAVQPGDYTALTQTLTFTPGQTSKTVAVAVKGDTLDESDETFVLNVRNPVNATLADSTSHCTITDNDPPPGLSIDDVTVTEGNAGTVEAEFTVTLSAAGGKTVTVNWATADGTASQADDYVSGSGVVSFSPGETSRKLTVSVRGDSRIEPDEGFSVNLSNAVNATIQKGAGVCTIATDDPAGCDLSGDGVVDAQDVLLLAAYLTGRLWELPCGRACADVDGDGRATARDLTTVLHNRCGL